MDISVQLTGPMFTKEAKPVVEKALGEEALRKISERMERSARSGGKKALGRRRNTITQTQNGLVLDIDSTLIWPRTKGSSWYRKNERIITAMTKNVLRKAGRRIAEELG